MSDKNKIKDIPQVVPTEQEKTQMKTIVERIVQLIKEKHT